MSNYDFLLPAIADPTDTFRFGVVTATSPWRVRLDGDIAAIDVNPIITCEIGQGDRVLCLIHNRQLIVTGRVGSFTAAIELGNTENLNDLTSDGTWHQAQNAESSTSRNYPQALAGMLEVFNMTHIAGGTTYIYQRYTVYNGTEVWVRTNYNGTWNIWRRLIGSTRTVDWTTVTGWDSTVELYNVSVPVQVCAVGGAIFLSGAMRWKSGTSGKIGNLPSWAYPDTFTIKAWRCQGSSNNAWGLEINSSNELRWGRHGPAAATTDGWLPFSVSWPQVQ